MKKVIEITVILILSVTVLYVHSNYSKVVTDNGKLHERIDVLMRDSVKCHKWIENVKSDITEYKPTSTSVECNLNE